MWRAGCYETHIPCCRHGRITAAGTVTNHYTTPGINGPGPTTTGRDGALWFGNDVSYGSVGRITTTGQVSTYGAGISWPNAIAAGPDGALWTISYTGEIMRVTTAGQVTTFTGVGDNTYGMAAGPDGPCGSATPSTPARSGGSPPPAR